MEWKKEYEHGITWQDTQHEQLLDNIKHLLKMVVSGETDEQEYARVINFTIHYCNNHFKIEEKYMRKHGYPRTENHVTEHKQFINDFKKLISDGNRSDIEKSAELLNKMMSWFSNHILSTDKYLAEFIIKHQLF